MHILTKDDGTIKSSGKNRNFLQSIMVVNEEEERKKKGGRMKRRRDLALEGPQAIHQSQI